MNGSSGYGSTIINDSVKEDEEILRARLNTEQEVETKKHSDRNFQETSLNE